MKFADTITNQLVSVVEPRFGMIRNHQFVKPGQTPITNEAIYLLFRTMTFLIRSCARNVTNVRLDRNATLAEIEGREHSGGSCSNCCILLRGKACRPSEQQLGKKSHGLHERFPGGGDWYSASLRGQIKCQCFMTKTDGNMHGAYLNPRMGAMEVSRTTS